MERILVIDNDPAIQRLLRSTFEGAGFETISVRDGAMAMAAYSSNAPSAVILDLKLPGKRGQDLCREIRQISPEIPIVVLSSTDDEIDKVVLFELGADDYVTKPCSPREVLARVRTGLRRVRDFSNQRVMPTSEIQMDSNNLEALRAGISVRLTRKEFKLLRFLVNNKGRVVSVGDLLNEIGGRGRHSNGSALRTYILRLRRKLEANPQNPVHIKTIHGVGYKFVP